MKTKKTIIQSSISKPFENMYVVATIAIVCIVAIFALMLVFNKPCGPASNSNTVDERGNVIGNAIRARVVSPPTTTLPATEPLNTLPPMNKCDDTDKGTCKDGIEIYKKGVVTGDINGVGSGQIHDTCKTDGPTLIEGCCSIGDNIGYSYEVTCQFGCDDGVCKESARAINYCIDSDNGRNLGEKGRVYGTLNGLSKWDPVKLEYERLERYDSCDGDRVVEWFCTDHVGYSETMDCPTGEACVSGLCIPTDCTEFDGGKNYYQKSYITGRAEKDNRMVSSVDECDTSNSNDLYELYCENNLVTGEKYTCPNGCGNGACIKSKGTASIGESCIDNDECESGFCGYNRVNPDPTVHVCSAGESGTDLCEYDTQCASGLCGKHSICASHTGDSCSDNMQCDSENCENGVCALKSAGTSCYQNEECGSGNCMNSICVGMFGEHCTSNSDCQDGLVCGYLDGNDAETECVNLKGNNEGPCMIDSQCESPGHCTTYSFCTNGEVDSSCVTNEDCNSQMCINSVCVETDLCIGKKDGTVVSDSDNDVVAECCGQKVISSGQEGCCGTTNKQNDGKLYILGQEVCCDNIIHTGECCADPECNQEISDKTKYTRYCDKNDPNNYICKPKKHTLTISKSGTGTITANPGMICTKDCIETAQGYVLTYDYGTRVSLTALPSTGYSFTGWSGGTCTGTGVCVLAMNANKAATATFKQIVPLTKYKDGAQEPLGYIEGSAVYGLDTKYKARIIQNKVCDGRNYAIAEIRSGSYYHTTATSCPTAPRMRVIPVMQGVIA